MLTRPKTHVTRKSNFIRHHRALALPALSISGGTNYRQLTTDYFPEIVTIRTGFRTGAPPLLTAFRRSLDKSRLGRVPMSQVVFAPRSWLKRYEAEFRNSRQLYLRAKELFPGGVTHDLRYL